MLPDKLVSDLANGWMEKAIKLLCLEPIRPHLQ